MKAIVLEKYGSPSMLQLKEVPKPVPRENEVLIKVHASAVNDYDWSMARGKPYIYRLMFGLTRPKRPILGMELAGTIEALGARVTSFKVGDAVYGDTSDHGFGTFAEYICIHEKALVQKPEKMSFVEAASLSHASMLAYQGLVDVGKIQKGQKILINGAGGGVGIFALQIAKLYNAEVTGVDTGEKLKLMESLGFDHIIDYKQEDFTKNGKQYDLILDTKTNRWMSAFARSLKPDGIYVTVGGKLTRLIQILFFKRFSKKKMSIVGLKANKDLEYINQLYEEGKIKPVIDGPYPLSEAAKAVQYFGDGKHTGKVIISLLDNR